MSRSSEEPKPNGKCALCWKPITPGWDTSNKMQSSWFCSAQCSAESWLDWAEVPTAYWTFDPSLPCCGPEPIKFAELWIQSHNEHEEGRRPGLLLHSVRSGTGKTRVAIHLAILGLVPYWRGPAREEYRRANFSVGPAVVWLNARRVRKRYQETMHFSQAAASAAWVEDLCRCILLVLDEPDKLKPSEGLVEIIYGVLDERFANGGLTILTTNVSGQELERRWGPEYGPYLVRRIREFCLTINFDP